MPSKQLVSFVLVLLTTISLKNSSDSVKKLKYEICGNTSPPIDSTVRIIGSDFVYLITDDMVYKLVIKDEFRAKIEEMHLIYDWGEEIEPPIDLITTDDLNNKSIALCEIGTEWTVKYEEGVSKGTKKFECQRSDPKGKPIELVYGKLKAGDMVNTKIFIDYLDEPTVLDDGNKYADEMRNRETSQLLRTNDSSDSPHKFIKWVYEAFNDQEIKYTFPFTALKGNRISAAFIYDFHYYLFGGRYYCRVKLNDITFENCTPLPVTDWINNCDEEEEEVAIKDQTSDKPSTISVRLMVLMAIIVVVIIVILIIFVLIYKEASKKGSTSTNQPSPGLSAH